MAVTFPRSLVSFAAFCLKRAEKLISQPQSCAACQPLKKQCSGVLEDTRGAACLPACLLCVGRRVQLLPVSADVGKTAYCCALGMSMPQAVLSATFHLL